MVSAPGDAASTGGIPQEARGKLNSRLQAVLSKEVVRCRFQLLIGRSAIWLTATSQ
jgi:hypothetical protein